MGFINQLITGGHHIVAISFYDLTCPTIHCFSDIRHYFDNPKKKMEGHYLPYFWQQH